MALWKMHLNMHLVRNVDDDHNRSYLKDLYHHHKTEWMTTIIKDPRTQHLFKPDMDLDFDFPEILSSCGASVEQLPSVMALQQIINANHIVGS